MSTGLVCFATPSAATRQNSGEQHEHSCVRCPLLRPDPDQHPRLIEIRDNLKARVVEAEHYGWLGEIAGLQASLTAAEQKLDTMRQLADRHPATHLGMPDFRSVIGRATNDAMGGDTNASHE
jgi:hypothetical protein